MRSSRRLSLCGMTALVLATASPAFAFSGYGVSARLRAGAATVEAKKQKSTAAHTCQAGRNHEKTAAHSALVGDARKPAVVACEQPPRSHLTIPTLRQTAPNPITAFG